MFVSKMLIGVIMLIKLISMIDRGCIIVLWMVVFVLNTLQVSGGKIRCPCVRCKNQKFLKEDDVCNHLLIKDFLPCYEN
jgi:hypothetical protein